MNNSNESLINRLSRPIIVAGLVGLLGLAGYQVLSSNTKVDRYPINKFEIRVIKDKNGEVIPLTYIHLNTTKTLFGKPFNSGTFYDSIIFADQTNNNELILAGYLKKYEPLPFFGARDYSLIVNPEFANAFNKDFSIIIGGIRLPVFKMTKPKQKELYGIIEKMFPKGRQDLSEVRDLFENAYLINMKKE